MALGIDYNSGIPHTNGAPTHDPGTNGGKLAYDHVNRVKYKHVSGTTWEVDASGGGGGDSLGTGFTSGGGSGLIPDGTVAEIGTSGDNFIYAGSVEDFTGFTGVVHSGQNYYGAGINDGYNSDFSFTGSFSDGSQYRTQYIVDPIGMLVVIFDDINHTQSGAHFSSYGPIFRSSDGLGARYGSDYSATIATNDLSIPDVGTLKAGLIPHMPRQVDNSTALNGETFYSTDNSKLCFKDLGGTVNDLY